MSGIYTSPLLHHHHFLFPWGPPWEPSSLLLQSSLMHHCHLQGRWGALGAQSKKVFILSTVQVLGQYLLDSESECLLEFCALGATLSSLYSWPCSLPSFAGFLFTWLPCYPLSCFTPSFSWSTSSSSFLRKECRKQTLWLYVWNCLYSLFILD